jgi:RimJ/RimL family protein N-acetyltransferase
LIYEDQTPIGVTGVSVDRDDPSGKTAIFWGSWLAPRARGKGLSDLMYKTRIDWVRAQAKVEKIIVSHRASNLRSKFANQKHGFVFTRRIAKVWNDGKTEDEIFYELRLNR